MENIEVARTLDVKGLNCPLPVLKAKKALDGIAQGQVLEVISTDPGSTSDIITVVERLGHELLHTKELEGKILFYIKKK